MPQAVVQAPSLSTRTPDIRNTGTAVSFSVPVFNSGSGPANNIRITEITFGGASRQQPVLPLVIGDLGADNSLPVNAVFPANGFAVGGRYLATIRGLYESGSATYGFTLNRYLTIPAAAALPVAFLAAHLQAVVDPVQTLWKYTVFNDELAGSVRYINSVHIEMVAPFTVNATPPGWAVLTDNFSYVLWYAQDAAHRIAPGASLGTFEVQSARTASEGRGYTVTSWNQQANQKDRVALATIQVPSRN